MLRLFFLSLLVVLITCSTPTPDTPVIRLVDVFGEATVDGISTDGAELPRTEWRFDKPDHRWKAGPGVAGLAVRDGRLVGRATTDVPIVHVERTSGLGNPDAMQGQSLVPLMSAEDPSRAQGWRGRPAISERTRSPALRDPESANGVAIVWEGWKLIHNKERPEGYPEYELFDQRDDPLNFVNLAAEHPDKVEELKRHLEAWRRWVGARRLPSDAELTEGVSSEELERLRSLGYVQ